MLNPKRPLTMFTPNKLLVITTSAIFLFANSVIAEITERKRPDGWENLVYGGRFMDRLLPSPIRNPIMSDTWGGDNVKPRDVLNGIEEPKWSYWGGNIKQDENGKYHLYVARWKESHPKGHSAWPGSHVVRAESDNPWGPFKMAEYIGDGHNPEIYQNKDGSYSLYVIHNFYHSPTLTGPWKKGKYKFDKRGRSIIEGFSNYSFVSRGDGSVLAVSRGGGIWVSDTGLGPWERVSNSRVYPKVKGRFEDPVIWKTEVQYHMIVNDWFGRIAWYLRSKDGFEWTVEDGEAYTIDFDKYEDGTSVDWYKYERIRVLQDEHGRAFQANFAVIDTIKKQDKPNDIHNSKNITIPLTVGRRLQILNDSAISTSTKEIQVKVLAEKDFNPHKDLNIDSLRFGSSKLINYGNGSKVKKTVKSGDDLILVFNGKDTGLTKDNFAGKLLGKATNGDMLFGWSRLPGVEYNAAFVSADKPKAKLKNGELNFSVDVKNYGLSKINFENDVLKVKVFSGKNQLTFELTMPSLKANEVQTLKTKVKTDLKPGALYKVEIKSEKQDMALYQSGGNKKFWLKL